MSELVQEGNRLAPTLWRTCRALANRKRLRMLQYLMKHPDATVSSVGAGLRVPVATASVYLRALNARGVLVASRKGPWVHYRMAPDPTVREASVLVAALEEELRRGPAGVATAFHALTAFTHPRRISIVVALCGSKGMAREDLRRHLAFSRTALILHIDKLMRRGLVVDVGDILRVVIPQNPLARALLRIAMSS